MLGIWFYPVNTCGNNWINGAFDDEESWEHVSFVNALLFPFLFWLFSPWLEELYNVFPLSFSVAGRAGKTWWGPRKTVNGRDFQWSSWSADKCLTWEEWRCCQLGPGASLLLWGNIHRWRQVQLLGLKFCASSSLPFTLYFSSSHCIPSLPGPSLLLVFPQWALWWIFSYALWTIISPLGQEDTWEAWGVAEETWLDYKPHAFLEFN